MNKVQEQIDSLRVVQKCIYLAAESEPAKDISDRCRKAADTMEALLKVVETAKTVHGMDSVSPGDCAVCDALSALEAA